MRLDYVDILFLHSPDPNIPLEQSAAAIAQLKQRGLCRWIGISNASAEQINRFADVVQTDAIQCPLNMIQRDHRESLIAPSAKAGRQVYVFWTLMKGLLAGKITRDHVFEQGDSRPGYAIFQGETRRRVHDAIDRLRELGKTVDQTVAQLSVGWAISQPGVTAALVGARRPDQIRETLHAQMMSEDTLRQIDSIVAGCV